MKKSAESVESVLSVYRFVESLFVFVAIKNVFVLHQNLKEK